jgi:hypothetical protein
MGNMTHRIEAVLPLLFALALGSAVGCGDDATTPPPPPDIDCELADPVADLGTPGILYTFAGTGANGWLRQNNDRLDARFSQPVDMLFRSDGQAYILDWNNHMVRLVGLDGKLNTVVGNPDVPFTGDGPKPRYPELDDFEAPVDALKCYLNHPTEMAPLPGGDYLITCWHNHKIRRYDPVSNTEQVIIGSTIGYGGDARVNLDWDEIVVADAENYHYRVYRATAPGGYPEQEIARVYGSSEYVDGGVALGGEHYYAVTAVLLENPGDPLPIFSESDYSAEIFIRAEPGATAAVTPPTAALDKIAPDAPTGLSGTGGGPFPYHDSKVHLKQPTDSSLGPDGHLYILDQQNQRIRRVRDFMTDPDGIIETVAGTGTFGYNGDGAPLETRFHFEASTNPQVSGGMVIHQVTGIIFIADTLNHIVRAVDLVAGSVTTIAGIPESPGTAGDNGPALSAQLHSPLDLEIGPDGRLYVADEYNNAVRAIDLATGMLETVAGTLGQTSGADCFYPPSALIGDGKPATQALLNHPRGVAFDLDGRLYITDTFHNRIRVMTLEVGP